MSVEMGNYGFVTIRDGAYKNELGFYLQDVEPDEDGVNRAHVAIVEKSKVIITRLANLEWCPNQEDMIKRYEFREEIAPCPTPSN